MTDLLITCYVAPDGNLKTAGTCEIVRTANRAERIVCDGNELGTVDVLISRRTLERRAPRLVAKLRILGKELE